MVNTQDLFDGLQFRNQAVFNQDINTISTIEVDTFLLYGQQVLSLNRTSWRADSRAKHC